MTATYIIGSEKIPVEISNYVLHDPVDLVSNLVVSARTRATAVSTYSIKDANAFYLGVVSDTGSPTISIEVEPIVSGVVSLNSGAVKLMSEVAMNGDRALSDKYEVRTNDFRIWITNHSNESRTFELIMYKSNSNGSQFPTSQNTVIEKMEYYGKTLSERPSPSSVPVGAIYMAIDTQELWQSNGTEWKVL